MADFKQLRSQPGFWGEESALKDKPVYIHTGYADTTVVPTHSVMQKRYFESVGADVEFEVSSIYPHWFNEATTPAKVSAHCYKPADPQLYAGSEMNDDWHKYGFY